MADDISGPDPAQRLGRKRWTDPRLLVGIVLVAVAVVAGAAVVRASDDTTAVWALRTDVHEGETPRLSDLERVDVHVDQMVAERYLGAAEDILAERLEASVWARDVPAGELLAVSALTPREQTRAGELPLGVAVGSMPTDLRPGYWVDVWVGPGRSGSGSGNGRGGAERVLERVRVQDVEARSSALGDGGGRVVLVALDDAAVDDLAAVLDRVGRGAVTLVRVGSPGSS